MKINKKEYSKIKHYDFQKPCRKQSSLLNWFVRFVTSGDTKNLKVNYLTPTNFTTPSLVLFNHMSFLDFKVMAKIMQKNKFNFVMAIDGFLDAEIIKIQEFLLRRYGVVAKRKFTNDLQLIKNIKYCFKNNQQNFVMFPEARYSLEGATAQLPDALGKMIKLFHVPVIVVNMHGNHLVDPFWNASHKNKRSCPISADVSEVLTKDDSDNLSIQNINNKIRKAFYYNEYEYQKENNIIIDNPKRAEGLHKILYKCPNCLNDFTTISNDSFLHCTHCNSTWQLTENGSLHATNGKNIFDKVTDWFNWERECVRKEILDGKYNFEDDVKIYAIPNSKKKIYLGIGHLTHDSINGYHLTFKNDLWPIDIIKEPLSMYSCHIEYNYKKIGDMLDISNINDTYFVSPVNHNNFLTKFHFATEEIYKIEKSKLK